MGSRHAGGSRSRERKRNLPSIAQGLCATRLGQPQELSSLELENRPEEGSMSVNPNGQRTCCDLRGGNGGGGLMQGTPHLPSSWFLNGKFMPEMHALLPKVMRRTTNCCNKGILCIWGPAWWIWGGGSLYETDRAWACLGRRASVSYSRWYHVAVVRISDRRGFWMWKVAGPEGSKDTQGIEKSDTRLVILGARGDGKQQKSTLTLSFFPPKPSR